MSPEFLVKICGITNLDDALSSVRLGANALGFNFYPKSPRYLDPEEVEGMLSEIPDHVLTVAVMVVGDEDGLSAPSEVVRRVPSIGAFQLHGLHRESEIPTCEKPLFIATSPMEVDRFPNQEILIDTSWGRGKTENWEDLRRLDRTYILSGGLRPGNVAEALELLQPAGVDVCSGVEREPGIKDVGKLKRFMENVARAKRAPAGEGDRKEADN
jgi:phosphoribosylanthranilate isomerase